MTDDPFDVLRPGARMHRTGVSVASPRKRRSTLRQDRVDEGGPCPGTGEEPPQSSSAEKSNVHRGRAGTGSFVTVCQK
jgi:hypothetical protein